MPVRMRRITPGARPSKVSLAAALVGRNLSVEMEALRDNFSVNNSEEIAQVCSIAQPPVMRGIPPFLSLNAVKLATPLFMRPLPGPTSKSLFDHLGPSDALRPVVQLKGKEDRGNVGLKRELDDTGERFVDDTGERFDGGLKQELDDTGERFIDDTGERFDGDPKQELDDTGERFDGDQWFDRPNRRKMSYDVEDFFSATSGWASPFDITRTLFMQDDDGNGEPRSPMHWASTLYCTLIGCQETPIRLDSVAWGLTTSFDTQILCKVFLWRFAKQWDLEYRSFESALIRVIEAAITLPAQLWGLDALAAFEKVTPTPQNIDQLKTHFDDLIKTIDGGICDHKGRRKTKAGGQNLPGFKLPFMTLPTLRRGKISHYYQTLQVKPFTVYSILSALILDQEFEHQDNAHPFRIDNFWLVPDISPVDETHAQLQKLRALCDYFVSGQSHALKSGRKAVKLSLKRLSKRFTRDTIASSSMEMKIPTILPSSSTKRIQDVDPRKPKYLLVPPEFASMGGHFLETGHSKAERFTAEYPEVLIARLLSSKLESEDSLVIDNVRRGGTWDRSEDSWKRERNIWAPDSPNDGIIAIPETDYHRGLENQYNVDEIVAEANKVIGALTGEMDRNKPVVSGIWGCRDKGGDAELKFMIQWIATSMSGMTLTFLPEDSEMTTRLREAVDHAKGQLVGDVWENVLAAASECSGKGIFLDAFMKKPFPR